MAYLSNFLDDVIENLNDAGLDAVEEFTDLPVPHDRDSLYCTVGIKGVQYGSSVPTAAGDALQVALKLHFRVVAPPLVSFLSLTARYEVYILPTLIGMGLDIAENHVDAPYYDKTIDRFVQESFCTVRGTLCRTDSEGGDS